MASRPLRADVSARRLSIVVALVAAMVITLFGRLYYVQLLDPHKPVQTAGSLHDGTIVVPAPRGEIVDARGNVLVGNTSQQVLTVSRDVLQALPDGGTAVLGKLSALLGTTPAQLSKEITPCSPKVPAPCWTGEPYTPVPVATNAPISVVLAVSEHREQFPGVELHTVTLPSYPGGTMAAHVLGYTGSVNATDEKANKALTDSDTVGRTGLEAQYDSVLRGIDGTQVVQLNPQGSVVGQGDDVLPVQGDTLVTSIDANVQRLAEQSLAQQIHDSRAKGMKATSGAVVVLDPQTGRVIAAASYPTYDPQLFVGGISNTAYAALTDPGANDPLLSRAIAGQYAPGSTFKLITSSSLVTHHEISLTGTYPCPGSLSIDGRVKTNFDSESFGSAMSLRQALGYSCDTFFYAPAAREYYTDQAKIALGKKASEYLQQTAAAFGVGRAPQIDLPAGEQASGSFADRETRMARWTANRAQYCADAKHGFPDEPNSAQRAYLTALATENCTDGWRYRAGDNADMAIGQGETTVSPLQLALAYSAMVNGGKMWEPTLGWAVVDGAGKVVRSINPKVHSTVPVSPKLFDYIADSLSFKLGWQVSGAFAYLNSPYRNEIGGKTGTAEVFGHQDTSWLATWGPVSRTPQGDIRARFVVVGMVEQAGTGARAAGPMLKRIWDGLLGAKGSPVIAGSRPATTLPQIAPQVRVATTNGSGGAPLAPREPVGPPEAPTYPPRTGGRR
ncbi:MAG TPA: penicillin-binding transpeptidase domain-containing protein [Jatrophihabitantaceae bacterium]|nr:penicillin-binding transpeptidase domain-containing protein [Jatrophihabitantaceae bacterium]